MREAQLKQEDGSFVKVAVKMLKGELDNSIRCGVGRGVKGVTDLEQAPLCLRFPRSYSARAGMLTVPRE